MVAGKHKSQRVALAVPPKLHEQLSAWADFEGRPLASLCMYLIEQSLRSAQVKGIAPSFKDESNKEGDDGWVKDDDEWQKFGKQATADFERRQQEQWLEEDRIAKEKYLREANEENKIGVISVLDERKQKEDPVKASSIDQVLEQYKALTSSPSDILSKSELIKKGLTYLLDKE